MERLPVDQHLLKALVAPRALLDTEGTQDAWTNPEGAQLTHLAAKKVYDFLEAGDKISIRYRPVGHIPSNDDLLDFADHVFFHKAAARGVRQAAVQGREERVHLGRSEMKGAFTDAPNTPPRWSQTQPRTA